MSFSDVITSERKCTRFLSRSITVVSSTRNLRNSFAKKLLFSRILLTSLNSFDRNSDNIITIASVPDKLISSLVKIQYSAGYLSCIVQINSYPSKKQKGNEFCQRRISQPTNMSMSFLSADLKKLQSKQGVKFKSGFLNLVAKKVVTAEAFTIMRNPQKTWKLDEMEYENQNFKWSKIFEFMIECQVEVLLLSGNQRSTILKEIRNPMFLGLKCLTLSNNKIVSLEMIAVLNCPKLQNLDVSYNQIVYVRSINHLIVPIVALKLSGNPLVDVYKIERCTFSGLRQLHLQEKSRDTVIGQSLRWLCKGTFFSLNQLHCASRKRLREETIWRQLAQKYPKGKIRLA